MSSSTKSASEHTNSLSRLLNLPRELRELIYAELLLAHGRPEVTFGRSSKIEIAILSTCTQVYDEASPLLSKPRHILRYDAEAGPVLWDVISPSSILRLRRIELVLCYRTANRGDCEVEIIPIDRLASFTEAFGLTLRRSNQLHEVHIELQNKEQRKRGPKRLRSELVMHQMKQLLYPFAYLQTKAKVTVGGFDTIDFADMFNQMRDAFAGKEIPFKNMLYAGLGSGIGGTWSAPTSSIAAII